MLRNDIVGGAAMLRILSSYLVEKCSEGLQCLEGF